MLIKSYDTWKGSMLGLILVAILIAGNVASAECIQITSPQQGGGNTK